MKKTIRIVAYIIIGFLVALFLLPFVFEDEIKDGIRQAMNESLNARVDFEDVSLSFIRDFPNAQVAIGNLSIEGIDTFENIPLFNAEKTVLEIDLASLISKESPYKLLSVQIEKPIINILRLEDGGANYLITKESEEQANYTIDLSSYELKNATLIVEDKSTSFYMKGENISHQGSGRFTQDIFTLSTKTKTNDLTSTYLNIPVLTGSDLTMDGDIEVDLLQNKYTFKENKINLNALEFSIVGDISLQETSMEMDLSLDAPDAKFTNLFSLIPFAYTKDYQDAKIDGSADINGKIKGTYSEINKIFPAYNMSIKIADGQVQYPKLPKSITNINAEITIDNPTGKPSNLKVNIPDFKFNMDDDFMKGRLLVSGDSKNPLIDAFVNTKLDFKNWKNALPLAADANIKGKINSDIKLKSSLASITNKDYQKIVFSGNLSADGIFFQSKQQPAISLDRLILQAEPKVVTASFENAYYNASDLSGEATLTDPLSYFDKSGSPNGTLKIKSKRINGNEWMNQNTATGSGQTTTLSLPEGRYVIEAKVDEIVVGKILYKNNELKGEMSSDQITISSMRSEFGSSNISAKAKLNNVTRYMNGMGSLTGEIIAESSLLDLNQFMVESSESEVLEPILIPKNMDISFTANAVEVKYGKLTLKEVKGLGKIQNQRMEISDLNSKSLGGGLSFQGLYSTSEPSPEFNLKLDLNNVQFQNAFEELTTFKLMAPIAAYIKGVFNSTLVMSGNLDDKMMPLWDNLNASGYLETKEGSIAGYAPIEGIANKLGIDKLKKWSITNTKNWFEVVDGNLELKEETHKLGQDISLKISGRHGLGKKMDYLFFLQIPRTLLRQNALTGNLDKGWNLIEGQASKLGINLEQGEYVILKINMIGPFLNPAVSIAPVGTSGKNMDEVVKGEIAKKQQELEDQVNNKITETKNAAKDSLQSKKDKIVDSVKIVLNQKTKQAKDSVNKVLEKEVKSKVDSLLKKPFGDSIPFPSKTGKVVEKEIEKIQDGIKKWNPFKKKTTTNQDTISKENN